MIGETSPLRSKWPGKGFELRRMTTTIWKRGPRQENQSKVSLNILLLLSLATPLIEATALVLGVTAVAD
jgi:hypothetical protein